jgi:hypothetical protein
MIWDDFALQLPNWLLLSIPCFSELYMASFYLLAKTAFDHTFQCGRIFVTPTPTLDALTASGQQAANE